MALSLQLTRIMAMPLFAAVQSKWTFLPTIPRCEAFELVTKCPLDFTHTTDAGRPVTWSKLRNAWQYRPRTGANVREVPALEDMCKGVLLGPPSSVSHGKPYDVNRFPRRKSATVNMLRRELPLATTQGLSRKRLCPSGCPSPWEYGCKECVTVLLASATWFFASSSNRA